MKQIENLKEENNEIFSSKVENELLELNIDKLLKNLGLLHDKQLLDGLKNKNKFFDLLLKSYDELIRIFGLNELYRLSFSIKIENLILQIRTGK